MAFISLLFYIFTIYIRPQEWVPAVYGWPLVNIAAITTAVFFLFSPKKKFVWSIQSTLMVAFLCALIASHLSHFYFGGAQIAFEDFSKVIILFLFISNIVDSMQKCKIAIGFIVLLTVILALQGIHQFNTGTGLANQPLVEQQEGGTGRITWIGIFNDPNDLALAFVIVVPFVISWMLNGSFFIKPVALAVLGMILYGAYLTESRGGILALLAVILSYSISYFRERKRLVLGIILSIAFAVGIFYFASARMQTISPNEESAYGRIEAWYEGIQLFKSAPIFGVGYKMFTDYHVRTAHNSFVLCFAETGIVGYLIWVALFYLNFLNLVKIRKLKGDEKVVKEAKRLAFDLEIGLVGFFTGAFFLSRTYIPLPYILVGLTTAFSRIEGTSASFYQDRNVFQDLKYIVLIAIASMLVTYAIIKVSV